MAEKTSIVDGPPIQDSDAPFGSVSAMLIGQATMQRDRSTRASPVMFIYLARALRDFCDGFVAVLLPVYLTILGLGAFEIGIIATLALLGSALMTLIFGALGARIDQRKLLIAAAGLMAATGFAFAGSSTYAVVLLISFMGTINPSSGSSNVFTSLEQSILSHAVADQQRTRIFARYSLIGALAGAVGALAAGVPEILAAFGLAQIAALQIMFVAYAIIGLAGGAMYAFIAPQAPPRETKRVAALGPSRRMVIKMAALFSIDSLASGFAVQSLIVLWLLHSFELSLAAAGLFFFWSGVASAFSFPVAAWLAGRIGLVNTMVYTHIPSSFCLIFAALAPNLEIALALLLLRAALSQMDVPTRSSYVMAVVTAAERPAAASITSVSKSLAAAISPAFGGALFAAGYEIWPLIICGVLKILYDLALLLTLRHIKPPEEQ